MTRETLERKIEELQDEVVLLGSMVEQALLDSVSALVKRNLETARRVYADDRFVNDKRFDIENRTLIVIATQQPLAGDLRILATILEIISNLERMGDYAKGIARITLMLGEEPALSPMSYFPEMASLVVDMLHRALQAFLDRDVAAAQAIPPDDDKVDAYYNQAYRDLIKLMGEDGEHNDQANFLLWVAHNLERTADRVINICERTIFVVTGELFEFKSSDDEVLADNFGLD